MLIACATDHRYAEMTGVLMASLAAKGGVADAEIVVFGIGLGARDKDRIRASAAAGASLRFVDLDRERMAALAELRTRRHLTVAAYTRMLMPDMLPERRGRLLYLDCDMVVNRSLAPLAALDMEGKPVAAVHNSARGDALARINAGIDRPAETPYFNSGLLVIDLDEWRERGIGPRSMAYARGRTGRILHHDQDVLNRIVGPDWVELPGGWNRGVARLSLAECEATEILHFKGRIKPFHADYREPARQVYDRYRALTPWANARRVGALEREAQKRWSAATRALRALWRKPKRGGGEPRSGGDQAGGDQQ